VFLGSAILLKGFYILLYPFMYVLNMITNVILKWMGIDGSEEHESSLTEEEIRASLSIAHAKGELSKNEHKLLNAVFKFDDEVARQIMKPRNEVEFLDSNNTFGETLSFAKNSKHTRFPYCDGSLDKLIGVLHIKDLIGYVEHDSIDIKSMVRTPLLIPENMLIGRLLQEFRMAKQHLAFVQDEHGTTLGIVTLEDVLEELVGNLQDEFDVEEPDIVELNGKYIVDGDIQIDDLNDKFDIYLKSEEADTLSGLIVEKFGHKLKKGQIIKLGDQVEAEIIEVEGIRATKISLYIKSDNNETH